MAITKKYPVLLMHPFTTYRKGTTKRKWKMWTEITFKNVICVPRIAMKRNECLNIWPHFKAKIAWQLHQLESRQHSVGSQTTKTIAKKGRWENEKEEKKISYYMRWVNANYKQNEKYIISLERQLKPNMQRRYSLSARCNSWWLR